MADNVAITAGSGTSIAADDIGGVLTQRVKLQWGPDGTVNDADIASGKPIPVQLRTATGTATPLPALGTAGTASTDVITVQGIASGTAQPISGTVTANIGTGTLAAVTTVSTVSAVTAITNALPAGTNAIGKLSANSGVDIGDVDVTTVGTITPGTAATSLGKAIDSAIGATDTGIAMLAIRDDALSTLTPVESDYVPLRTNSTGALWVTGSSGATEYTEDAAAAADPVGGVVIGVRQDTLATNTVSADGDNIAIRSTNKGQLHVLAAIDSTQLAALQTTQPAMSSPGSQSVILPSDMPWPKGLSNRVFSTTFATLTRPANTTAYTAADSISDNATAGSVTALVSGNISDVNDDPIFISEIMVNSTDTGLAGKKVRAYLYNANPTSSSGVGGGDNAAFANKKAGYLGSFMGWMETGFSDGTVGRLVPTFNETNNSQAGGYIVTVPVSGARTLYIQYQAVEAFTPSANSTTIIGTAKGWQGRAA